MLNRRNKFWFSAIFIALLNYNAIAQITVNDYPETATRSTSTEYEGTLTEVAQDIANETDGRNIGVTIFSIILGDLETEVGESEACCRDDGEDGVLWAINNDNTEIKGELSIEVEIATCTWKDYASAPCQSAKDEWDRFSRAVEDHEQEHFDAGKDFWVKDTIKSYYDELEFDIVSPCVPYEDLEEAKSDCVREYLDILEAVGKEIGHDLDESDQVDENTQPTDVDESKDC